MTSETSLYLGLLRLLFKLLSLIILSDYTFLRTLLQCGMRSYPDYPNTRFNIFFDIEGLSPLNFDHTTFAALQEILANNYPKARVSRARHSASDDDC